MDPILNDQLILGWREWVALPELNLLAIEAKLDTGAATTALHAQHIEVVELEGRTWAHFETQPLPVIAPDIIVECRAQVVDQRSVTQPNGYTEERIVVRSMLRIGISLDAPARSIELALTDRSAMQKPLLIGREALAGFILVDSDSEEVLGCPPDPLDFYTS